MTLLFLLFCGIVNDIFDNILYGFAVIRKMLTDGNDGISYKKMIDAILHKIDSSILKSRFRFMVILETPVPFFDDFRRRSKDRIKATA